MTGAAERGAAQSRQLSDVAAVVLAAGAGSRFPGTKQVAEVDGLPLVAHAVATAHASEIDRVLVVVGHDGEEVARAAGRGGAVQVIWNPDHRHGQSSSLRAGIDAASELEGVEVVVILLGDQPHVSPEAVRGVTAAVRGGAEAARARYDDGPGHPVALARRVWPRIVRVEGDVGARTILPTLALTHVRVPGRAPVDVDTTSDLGRLGGNRGDRP